MANDTQRIGWIGMGRMGYPMAERLLKAGHDVSIWNRTRSKAEPLAEQGGKIVDKLSDLADMDVVFSLADRISVLVGGRIIASGSADDIRNDPFVRSAYLGEEDDDVIGGAFDARG